MRNAALILGLIGGLLALLVGFSVYGYLAFFDWAEAETQLSLYEMQDVETRRLVSVMAPILAIAGAAMARARALWGGVLMLLAAGGFYHAFGITVFTIFPITMVGIAGLLAVMAGRPDEEKAHF